jgi:hypothetical protein
VPDPQVFPAMANLSEEPVEAYGYLSDVRISQSGKEQRIQLRRHPVGGIEFAYLCPDLTDGQHIAALLYAHRIKPWVVPLWCHARTLGGSVGLGGTSITVDTVNAPFQDPLGLGLYAVIWSGPRTYEAVRIDTVSPTSITLLAGTTRSWAIQGTYVIPARVGYLVDEVVEHDWITSKITGGRVRFTFDAVRETLEAVAAPVGEIVFGELDEPPL